MARCVVLFSGGLDSTCLLGAMIHKGMDVIPISVDYAQRHKKELDAAREILEYYHIEHKGIRVDASGLNIVMKGSSQTSESMDVPEGHYADESMKLTVVPNRNMILLSIAAAAAISHGSDTIMFAAHSGDHPIYPDCRPEFIYRMMRVLEICSFEPIHLEAPFRNISKGDILKMIRSLGADVPFQLTWSCYKGLNEHCGKCGTCVERKEAFAAAGMTDPTVYAE